MNRSQRVLAATIISGVVAGSIVIVLFGYGLPVLVHNPGGPHETLCLESSHVNSPTNMSISLMNCGNYPATPLSYYVQDSGGNTYSSPNWNVPTIPLNTNVTLNILIDGKAFTFQHGNTYSIMLNTSRVHYTYTVTA